MGLGKISVGFHEFEGPSEWSLGEKGVKQQVRSNGPWETQGRSFQEALVSH